MFWLEKDPGNNSLKHFSGTTQDLQHNENQTSTVKLILVFDKNNAEDGFLPGERGSEKVGFKY